MQSKAMHMRSNFSGTLEGSKADTIIYPLYKIRTQFRTNLHIKSGVLNHGIAGEQSASSMTGSNN
jgi:hypothetical protein